MPQGLETRRFRPTRLLAGACLLLVAAAAPAGRETIGIWKGWGAFRDAVPRRCYAIATPVIGSDGGFASVASWPDRRLRASFYARLSQPVDPSAAVTMTIGERRFALAARGRDAWATDAAGDRAIVAALRDGRSMSIAGVAPGHRPFADTYALAGAATAIDAATLACTRWKKGA